MSIKTKKLAQALRHARQHETPMRFRGLYKQTVVYSCAAFGSAKNDALHLYLRVPVDYRYLYESTETLDALLTCDHIGMVKAGLMSARGVDFFGVGLDWHDVEKVPGL